MNDMVWNVAFYGYIINDMVWNCGNLISIP